MKTDVEIAREASLKPISEVGNERGLFESELEYYGPYKAKITDAAFERLRDADTRDYRSEVNRYRAKM